MNEQHNTLLCITKSQIVESLGDHKIVILPPMDIFKSSHLMNLLGLKSHCIIFDPWYNKGIGGERSDYIPYILSILDSLKYISDHIFFWGFPEIVARFVEKIPPPLVLRCWLTWYYKNSPSKIRGWRSAQMACLHLSHPEAKMHVENFLNDEQKTRFDNGKLRFIPGPPSVIEESLLCGFVGRNEQTGHPSQKPLSVIEKLILMSSARNELVMDLMSGSGTTAEAAYRNDRYSILCDISEEYTAIAEKRLNVKRVAVDTRLIDTIETFSCGLARENLQLPIESERHSSMNKNLQLSFDIK